MSDLYGEIFSRNMGFVTSGEQAKLRATCVGIAGAGGVGGLLAERLVRLGVGRLKITDPGDFEHSNLNRQFCSSLGTLGRNKAEVVSGHLREINPEAHIEWNGGGIRTQEDADAFVDGCDLVIDEMDFGLFREAIFVQRTARRNGVFYLFASAIGFGGLVVAFDPAGMTLEEYNGLEPDGEVGGMKQPEVPFERVLPQIPSYLSLIPDDIGHEILTGARGASTTSIGVGLASMLVANEAVNIILGRRSIPVAPEYTYVDLMDRKFVVGRC